MAEQIKIILRSFGEGVRSFVIPWNRNHVPRAHAPQSIDRYFVRVGGYLARACDQFEADHPEICHAN